MLMPTSPKGNIQISRLYDWLYHVFNENYNLKEYRPPDATQKNIKTYVIWFLTGEQKYKMHDVRLWPGGSVVMWPGVDFIKLGTERKAQRTTLRQ